MSNVVHSNHRVFSLRSLHHRTFRRLAQMMSNVVHSNHRCWMSTVCLQHHRIIIRTRFHAAACATRTQRITHPNSVPRCCLRHTHSTHHSSELDSTLLPAPHALNASLIRTRFHAAACATRTRWGPYLTKWKGFISPTKQDFTRLATRTKESGSIFSAAVVCQAIEVRLGVSRFNQGFTHARISVFHFSFFGGFVLSIYMWALERSCIGSLKWSTAS
jgi:hypothetical protein